jgi:hypothetical protein
MGRLFTGKKFRFIKRGDSGEILRQWAQPGIDLTAKVVCKSCNEGWMSNLEERHAKPSMADLIIGKSELELSGERVRAIARFAFKTAVVVDHMMPGEPFFSASVRHHFAKSLCIPQNVQMWLAGYLPMASGRFRGTYHSGSFDPNRTLELYVCTYAVGHFAFQVVSAYLSGIPSFCPKSEFDHVAIPFWPGIPNGVVWPPVDVIRTRDDFDAFSERWGAITLSG